MQSIQTEVLHHNPWRNSLTEFRLCRIGNCDNTNIQRTVGTTNLDVVESDTIADRRTWSHFVNKAELQTLHEVAGNTLQRETAVIIAIARAYRIPWSSSIVPKSVITCSNRSPLSKIVDILDTSQVSWSHISSHPQLNCVGTYGGYIEDWCISIAHITGCSDIDQTINVSGKNIGIAYTCHNIRFVGVSHLPQVLSIWSVSFRYEPIEIAFKVYSIIEST